MQLVFTGKVFVCRCSFEERHHPREAGFRWHPERKVWYTTSHGIASRLVEFADVNAKREIQRVLLTNRDWTGAIPVPTGLTPKDFQINLAVPFALARNRSYLALDPGLGKTICAALIRNAMADRYGTKTLYICPPFLLGNVEEELRKWGMWAPTIGRVGRDDVIGADIVLVPDSLLTRESVQREIEELFTYWRYLGVHVVMFVDEAHRFKNGGAGRTKALFDHFTPHVNRPEDRLVYLSGTPMPNRPMELYPVLSNSAPETIGFMSKFEFGRRYCAGYRGQWGWDFTGASNVQELAGKIVGTFMLRLRKKDVLPELPPKTEELVFIDDELPPVLSELNKRILARYSPEDLMKGKVGEEHVATYRRKLGIAKAKPAANYIKFLLEQGDESLLVFAHHREVIAELERTLKPYHPLVITGSVDKDERFRLAKLYQESEKHRLLILNIAAGGVGFNLTKATRVIFAEFSWVPGENDQAIDRAHRIGQTDRVLAQYLVHRNSIDRDVMEVVLRKKEITQHV